jgi:hypothetical protein
MDRQYEVTGNEWSRAKTSFRLNVFVESTPDWAWRSIEKLR